MELNAGDLAGPWAALATGLVLAIIAIALRTAPLARLRAGEMQHAFGAACVAIMLLWSIRTSFPGGPGYHFFGVTSLTLMFGWQLACLAALPVLVAGCLLGHGDWTSLGPNALVLFVLPAAVTWGLLHVVRRWLPRNFFVFIYLNGYFAAASSMAITTLAMSAALAGAGATGGLWRDYLAFLPLLSLAEGFINGMVLTVLVATRPGWVWTFDDESYLA